MMIEGTQCQTFTDGHGIKHAVPVAVVNGWYCAMLHDRHGVPFEVAALKFREAGWPCSRWAYETSRAQKSARDRAGETGSMRKGVIFVAEDP